MCIFATWLGCSKEGSPRSVQPAGGMVPNTTEKPCFRSLVMKESGRQESSTYYLMSTGRQQKHTSTRGLAAYREGGVTKEPQEAQVWRQRTLQFLPWKSRTWSVRAHVYRDSASSHWWRYPVSSWFSFYLCHLPTSESYITPSVSTLASSAASTSHSSCRTAEETFRKCQPDNTHSINVSWHYQ